MTQEQFDAIRWSNDSHVVIRRRDIGEIVRRAAFIDHTERLIGVFRTKRDFVPTWFRCESCELTDAPNPTEATPKRTNR